MSGYLLGQITRRRAPTTAFRHRRPARPARLRPQVSRSNRVRTVRVVGDVTAEPDDLGDPG
jgi:hypothetical protein